jgi:shikimate dehydrogenase
VAAQPFVVGLIGAGVGTSLTPRLHMAEARALGLVYVYRTIDLTALGLVATDIGELVAAARALGYDALNVTHPCKQLVVHHMDRLDAQAARLGAVNTVLFDARSSTGYNTDASGFAAAFRRGLPGAATTEVVQLGAGGAGAAVAEALLSEGVEHLTIVDLDDDRGSALARKLTAQHPGARVSAGQPDKLSVLLPGADGVVHCTPTGMADHPGLPLDPSLLHPGLWVAEVVYRPLDTPLLRSARSAGCRTMHGGLMAVFQAADTLRLVTGMEPDTERMLQHFQSLVEKE